MSINLTGPLPAPYKMLYDLENRTQELKVGWKRAREKMTEASIQLVNVLSITLNRDKQLLGTFRS